MSQYDGNVAFKCSYNDSGRWGFEGTCTNNNIAHNVKTRKTWCSHERCHCFKFYQKDFQNPRPHEPCHESRIYKCWTFGAGLYKTRQPISMKNAREGKVALLTTRHPKNDKECKRIVIGVYEISEISDENEDNEIRLKGKSEHAIRLPEDISFSLPYWNFKQYKGHDPFWGFGRFRYISDQEVTNFLHALYPMLRSQNDREVLEHLLECCGNMEPEDVAGYSYTEVDRERKYGPGGEGERHLRLKEYVAQHPEVLGLDLCQVTQVSVEHRFITGDRVDLSIELADGQHCVVEIEVEGCDSTLIGAHQAIKYRALRAAQLDMAKPRPCAFLVAYKIPQSTQEFCERHGVTALEIQPM